MGLDRVFDEAWMLVLALFALACIGGRTEAEHWDLTEQIFRDTVFVIATRAVRWKHQERHGTLFFLKYIDERKIFGTKNVWHRQTQVPIYDVHRMIIDMLDDPAIGGGIRHVADCFAAYLQRDDHNDEKIIDHALRLGNGAILKRLRFLVERFPGGAGPSRLCKSHISHAKLDPAQNGSLIVTEWRLRVPKPWDRERAT